MNKRSIVPSKYEGWLISLVLHGLLTIIFLFIIYDNPIDLSEYSNLTFSNYHPTDLPVIEKNVISPAKPTLVVAKTERTPPPADNLLNTNRKIDLPKRRMTEHDLNRIPIEQQGQFTNKAQTERIENNRESIHGVDNKLTSLDEEIFNAVKPGTKPSDKSVGKKIDKDAIPGQKGGELVFDKPYAISWDGVVRDVLYDPLPKYPEGLDQEAVIRIRITVLPNGTVGDLIPLQKADATLESVTMKTLKRWKLSPLKASDPQLNQTAIISFRFVLQ